MAQDEGSGPITVVFDREYQKQVKTPTWAAQGDSASRHAQEEIEALLMRPWEEAEFQLRRARDETPSLFVKAYLAVSARMLSRSAVEGVGKAQEAENPAGSDE